MIERALLAASLLAAPTAIAADVTPQKVEIEGMGPWGRVKVVMEPEYPPQALAARLKGSVEIAGRVGSTGALLDVVYTPDSPQAAVFVEPLKAVIGYWKFVTPTDDDCQPTATVVRNRVWFDLEGERPKMSVVLAPEKWESSPVAATMKAVTKPSPHYPFNMQRRGWQADVFAKVTVSPAGDVVDVTAQAYPKQEGFDLGAFVEATLAALRRYEFSPAAGLDRPREGCYTVLFRLK